MRNNTPDARILAVIFDLDGVLVSTDEYHYRSWQRLADEEGIPFDREFNDRFRGVSRMECLDMLLATTPRSYTEEEKRELAARKNKYYREMTEDLGPDDMLLGTRDTVEGLQKRSIKVGIASGSKNARFILQRIGLTEDVGAVVSGRDISNSKPHPEVFLDAARQLGVAPENCLVVEDAEAGIEAARRAGMRSLGIGETEFEDAERTVSSLAEIGVEEILSL
jgi:beta-phosphoglucomutase